MHQTVDMQIDQVTVYPDRARVVCLGELTLAADTRYVVVDDLPLTLDVESVRAGGQGSAQVRLLGVDVRSVHFVQTPAAQVQALEAQIEALEDQVRQLEDRRATLKGQLQHLDGLRNATTEYAWGLARGRTSVEAQAQLARFLETREGEVREAVRALDEQQRHLDRQLHKLRQELKQLQSQRPRQRYQAVLEVQVLQPGLFRPSLAYVVQRAGWQPLYDIRLNETPDGPNLELQLLAQVTQHSGQDWRNVALVFSTARPALNQRLPELHPWYIDRRQPAPPPAPGVPLDAVRAAKQAAPLRALAAAEAAPAEIAVAEVVESDLAVTFHAPGRTDIPSDGAPHKSLISRFDWTPRLDYITLPRHTDAVYRRARVRNAGPAPLLAGPAALFVGETFIGRNQLPYTPQAGEIELLLGVEERLTVRRELIRREVDKRLLRDRRVLTYGYKLELHNLLSQPAQVTVKDQLPVSRHEEIRVTLDRAAPEPTERTPLNILEWQLTLAPQHKATLTYDYTVEHPRTLDVVGLLD